MVAGRVPQEIRIGSVLLGTRPCVVAAGGEAELELLGATTADVIELRADLFAAPTPPVIVAALTRLRAAGRPILLTVRSDSEGGRAMPDATRAAIYDAGLPLVEAVDVELSSVELYRALIPQVRAAGKTAILSFHDFRGTPNRTALRERAERALHAGAHIAKLATTAHTLDDVRVLLEITLALRERGVVTLAMGELGTLSRVFFPAAGSLLTYGSVGVPTAPGQLPVDELSQLLRRFFPVAS